MSGIVARSDFVRQWLRQNDGPKHGCAGKPDLFLKANGGHRRIDTYDLERVMGLSKGFFDESGAAEGN